MGGRVCRGGGRGGWRWCEGRSARAVGVLNGYDRLGGGPMGAVGTRTGLRGNLGKMPGGRREGDDDYKNLNWRHEVQSTKRKKVTGIES